MLQIKDVTFGYGAQPLFDGLSVEFSAGRVYGFLGKNGAGKTTLFKIIAGALMANSGSCHVVGYDSSSRHPAMLQELYFVPESFYLPPVSIKRYEQMHAVFYPRFDAGAFSRMLIDLELGREQLLNTLSYGLKKRFLLAFGLACNTKILLLDEPTNGLDIPSKRILRKMLASTMSEDRTIIIATHQIKEIETVFDSLVFIDRGRIMLDSSLEAISQKLTFHTVPLTEPLGDYLYSEEIPGGYSVISRNESGDEGIVDIEFLFNAVTGYEDRVLEELAFQPTPTKGK